MRRVLEGSSDSPGAEAEEKDVFRERFIAASEREKERMRERERER